MKLHPSWRQNDFIGVSAALHRSVVAQHGERAGDRAVNNLLETTRTWSPTMTPLQFKLGVEVLVQNLIACPDDLTMRKRRVRQVDVPDGLASFVPDTAGDDVAWRMSRWFGLTSPDLNDSRAVRERLRHEMRRPRNSFDALYSRLVTDPNLTVEKVADEIVKIEATEKWPFEETIVGATTLINLRYNRILACDTGFMPTLRKLYPFEVSGGRVMKTVRGCPRPVNIFWLRVLNEFNVSEEILTAVERRLTPFDWTSASVKSAIAAVEANELEKSAKSDPVPQTKSDLKQDENLRRFVELSATVRSDADAEAVAKAREELTAMYDTSRWDDVDAIGKVRGSHSNSQFDISRTQILKDKLEPRSGVIVDAPFAVENTEALTLEDGDLVSHKPARPTAVAVPEGEEE